MIPAFSFQQPWWLLLGVLAAVLVFWLRDSIALHTDRRRKWALILRCVLYVLLLLALADPRLRRERDEVEVVWLADVSRSVEDGALRKRDELRAELAKAGLAGARERFGYFAECAVVETRAPDLDVPAADRAKTKGFELQDGATHLASALDLAVAASSPGYVRNVVVLSDGVGTAGAAEERIGALKREGVRVFTVPVEPPDRDEVLVRRVDTPVRVKEEQPFKAAAEVVSRRGGQAELDVFVNGVRRGTRRVELKPGTNRFEFTETVGGGKVFEIAVAVHSEKDTLADNNEAKAIVQTEGKGRVLLVTDKPEQARYLARAVQQEGILLDVRPARGAPATLGDLQNYGLVVVDNVAATELSRGQMALMADYVKEFGGGFLMLGGDQAFGLGGYFRTPVEEILPVRCDFQKQKEDPSLGLVLVIDKSGSMGGDKMELAKEAAKGAVELLSSQDYLGVVVFDGQAFWAVELALAGDKYSIKERIASLQPGGGTNMAPGMELAYAALSQIPAKLKHVILMTDGVSQPGPFLELAARMAQDRITVSTVGVGGDCDLKLMEEIAQAGNGRFYFTEDPFNIPQIFAKETMTASKSAINELPFLPQPVRRGEFLSGIDFSAAPFLLGYVVTELKPTAEVWLGTEKGEPLLATWRYGLGSAGAFTSDARARWAVEWLKWPGFGKFWSQLFRRLMRPEDLTHLPVRLEREREGFRVELDAVDSLGKFLADLEVDAVAVGPQGNEIPVALNAEAPGQYGGWIPAAERGAYHLHVIAKKGGKVIDQNYISAAAGYPDEFLFKPADRSLLKALAEGTGGTMDPLLKDVVSSGGRTAAYELELWPWLLAVALAVFLADLAAKRLPED
jgi:Mg-chelatase subunit ChlD